MGAENNKKNRAIVKTIILLAQLQFAGYRRGNRDGKSIKNSKSTVPI